MRSRVLVTGGLGFIGRHVGNEARAAGYVVDCVDDLSGGRLLRTGEDGCFDVVLVSKADDDAVLKRIVNGFYDAVFHLAACPRVPESVEDPVGTERNNVGTSLRLLEACRVAGARGKPTKFVFSSSSAVYGNAQFGPTSVESGAVGPESPYGLQKLSTEMHCRMYSKLYGVPTVCLRYFNVYGPGQYAGGPYTTVIAAWAHAALHGKPARFDGDGLQRRDYVHVHDVARANLAAAHRCPAHDGRAYNVGSGANRSNIEILTSMRRHFPGMTWANAPARAGDARTTLADLTRIEKELGWTATIELEKGLSDTLEWARKDEDF